MDTSKYYTVAQAAQLLGVTDSAIRNAYLEGRLAAVTEYGRRWIKKSDVEAYRMRTQVDGKQRRGRKRSE